MRPLSYAKLYTLRDFVTSTYDLLMLEPKLVGIYQVWSGYALPFQSSRNHNLDRQRKVPFNVFSG